MLFRADLKKSFKTRATHVTAYPERRLVLRDYNDLRRTEPRASQQRFRLEDLFITAPKLRLTSPPT